METVLIIDDDKLIRQIVGDVLLKNGYKVLTAGNPKDGLALLNGEKVDILLLDIIMPTESGLDMIPEIKEIDKDIAIIIMTAYASTDSAIEAIRKDVFDYVKKPVHPSELLHSIKNAVDKRRLIKDNRHLLQTQREKISRLELFEHISKAVSSTLDLELLLEKIMNISKSIFHAEACSILLLDSKTDELAFTVALGEKGEEVKEFRVKRGQGIAGWVLEHGKPLLISNAVEDDRFFKGVDNKTGFKTTTMIAVPLIVKGKTVGVIEVINKVDGRLFNEGDEETLIMMSGQIAIAIDNAKMTKDLKESKRKIEDYSKNLETMVGKRTKELEEANVELKSTQAQLLQTEKLSSLGQLAAGVAHEINNPIGFINSNLRTLGEYVGDLISIYEKSEAVIDTFLKKDRNSFSVKLRDFTNSKKMIDFDFIKKDANQLIEESKDGAYRVFKIVRDLRDFSRADDADRKFINIHGAIDSTINIVWNEIKFKAEIEKDYGDLPEVECLPIQLNQVFMNLLMNAAQAIDDKGIITIRTYAQKDKVFVEISDNGCGIPPENLSKLFDPFFTTKEPGKGTGLGLSVSYNIIKTHKGEFRVKSDPGEGTTFIIELPISMDLPEGMKVENAHPSFNQPEDHKQVAGEIMLGV